MKKSAFSFASVAVLSLSSMLASAQVTAAPQAMGGTIPRPQAMGGTIPRPQAMGGTIPRPQAMGGTIPRPQVTLGSMYSAILAFFGF